MIDANSQFFAVLTNVGMAKQANADALGIPWKITEMGVGDANGTDPIPNVAQTTLINEWRRRPLNQLKVDPANPAVIIAEQVIPADEGGKWIREIALYDADGDMVAVANCAPSFKPVLSQGSGRTQVVRMNFIVSSTGNITLKIDPSVVLATREYVDTRIMEELYKLDSKQSVRAATTANIVLAGLQVIDGVSLVAGDRVLVKSQTAAKDNGIYLVGVAAWQRASDADSSAEVTSAMILSVEQGATLADTRWQLVTDGAIVLGATALTFQNVTQGFAPISSPAFLGQPTASTPAIFDNTNKLATTEFVKKSSGNHAAIGSLSANTVLTAANTFGMGYLLNSVNPFTVTLPLGSTGPNGGVVNFTNVSTGAVTIKLPATNYVAGMPGVGDGGSIILKQFDTITLSTAGGTAWYAEDGSVRDVQSTAMQDLMTGKISIGQFGLGGVGAPVLGDFKAINTGGLYLAYGALVPNLATPNAPPESDNKVLGVLAITPRSDCTYYYVFETGTSSNNRRFWVGQYTMPGGVLYWSNLLSSDQLATQAQVDAGVLDNVVVTPKTMRWGFAASFGSNGYLAFPSWLGSFVIQWANGQVAAGAGTAHINLAMAFNTSLLAYSISTSSSATFMSCQGASVNGIDVLARTVSAGAIAVPAGVVGYTFICVGK